MRAERKAGAKFTHVFLKDPSKKWPTAVQLEALGVASHGVQIAEQSNEPILVGLDYDMKKLACWDQTMIDAHFPATSGSISAEDKVLDDTLRDLLS